MFSVGNVQCMHAVGKSCLCPCHLFSICLCFGLYRLLIFNLFCWQCSICMHAVGICAVCTRRRGEHICARAKATFYLCRSLLATYWWWFSSKLGAFIRQFSIYCNHARKLIFGTNMRELNREKGMVKLKVWGFSVPLLITGPYGPFDFVLHALRP